MPVYRVLGLLASELHDLRIDCLLEAVTPGWVANTVPFKIAITFVTAIRSRYYKPRSNCSFPQGASPVPRT